MTLTEAITAAGMTPPSRIAPGRWLRFPGIGKGHANRAGWCRVISPTLAVFGDWSSNFSSVWKDETFRETAETKRLLEETRRREREFARQQLARQSEAAEKAQAMLSRAVARRRHPYLERKGFPDELVLVHDEQLLVPVRDVDEYDRILSLQMIAPNGEKKFLPGGRTRAGVYRLGPRAVRGVLLCEGYATGLSLYAASRLLGAYAVLVCFSAGNLVLVAKSVRNALVCADNDESGTGEEAARKTALPWVMPATVGEDFNDMHRRCGLHAVVARVREVLS